MSNKKTHDCCIEIWYFDFFFFSFEEFFKKTIFILGKDFVNHFTQLLKESLTHGWAGQMAACVTMLTDMQHANAHLHDLCATGKSERDASLLPLIANVKRALEALMYAVVAALEQADMRDALVLNNESRAALPSARKQSTKKRKAQCKVETVVDDSKAGDSDDDNNNNNLSLIHI